MNGNPVNLSIPNPANVIAAMSIPCPAWLDSVVTYRPYGKDAKARDGVVSSPSICEVPQHPSCGSSDTLLVSTCDLVLSTESATTEVFHSTDAGASWKKARRHSPNRILA